ncbi:MAG: hypothetical protein AAF589_05185, partial [Planctomycetota bacterium]
MLRFDENPDRRPRNYLMRREQWRLLLLVAALGFVVIAMQQVQSPAFVATLERTFGTGEATEQQTDAAPDTTPLPPLDRERFGAVQDNTFFRKAETEAWFFTLGVLAGDAGPHTAPGVTYAQLASQPSVYRGQPVAVAGAIRRLEEVKPADNELGIKVLHRAILQPNGGAVWPITLYLLDAPR